MQRPYIGITGFMSHQETQAAFEGWPIDASHDLMIGVLASSTTLAGKANRWPNRYPRVADIAAIFSSHPDALNLIHFNADSRDQLGDELLQLLELGGLYLGGFQLNVTWPELNHLVKVRQARHLRIVLQIGNQAIQLANHNPEEVAQRVSLYGDLVDDVLFDLSDGRGRPFAVETTYAYLRAIHAATPHVGLGVAGGLSGGRLIRLKRMLHEFSRLSIDAQRRLRNEGDALDPTEMTRYLQSAHNLFLASLHA